MSQSGLICRNKSKKCQKKSKEQKQYLEMKQKNIACICSKHFNNEMMHTICQAAENQHDTCLCAFLHTGRYLNQKIISCKVSKEKHQCICNLYCPASIHCLSIEHQCICKSKYKGHKYCKAEEEDHECICMYWASNKCRKKLTLKHDCSCATQNCCKSNDEHKCICQFGSPKQTERCQSTNGHFCVCSYFIRDNDHYLSMYPISCRAKEDGHKSICICVLGIEFMRICPSKNVHSCQCALLNRCRKHSISETSFYIWNEWETNSNSYLYWIPEEVLKDCLLFLRKKEEENEEESSSSSEIEEDIVF
jgi:hypothetical protein